MAFRIVDAHLAVLKVAAFRDHGAARVSDMIARDHRVDVVDGDAKVVEPDLGMRLAQTRPPLEKREVESAVGEGDVARRAPLQFVQAEMAGVEGGQRNGLDAEHGEVTNSGHRGTSIASGSINDNAVPAPPRASERSRSSQLIHLRIGRRPRLDTPAEPPYLPASRWHSYYPSANSFPDRAFRSST